MADGSRNGTPPNRPEQDPPGVDDDPWADPDPASAEQSGGTGARWRRHRARRAAVQALYQWQLAATPVNELLAQFVVDGALKRADRDWFEAALRTITSNPADLDDRVAPCLSGRSFAELDHVERAVLRLGAWELVHRLDVPFRVVINEMVGLAKTFGAEDGHRFVNGVLDRLASDVRAIEVRAARQR